jgi:hypothetical protein
MQQGDSYTWETCWISFDNGLKMTGRGNIVGQTVSLRWQYLGGYGNPA